MKLPLTNKAALPWITGGVIAALAVAWLTFLKPRHGPGELAGLRKDLPSGCRERAKAVLGVDLEAFAPAAPTAHLLAVEVKKPAEFVETLLAPVDRNDCLWEGPLEAIRDAERKYVGSCELASGNLRAGKPGDDYGAVLSCLKEFLLFRAHLASKLTDPKYSPADLHPVLLESRLYPAILNDAGADPGTVADTAEILAKVSRKTARDRAIAAARVGAQARYLEWSRAPEKERKNHDRLDRSLDILSDVNPRDPWLAEIRLNLIRRSENAAALRKAALEYKDKERNSTIGDYYLAWAAHLNKDPERVKWHLQQMLAENPGDVRANYALFRLQKPAWGETPFVEPLTRFSGLAFALVP